MNKKHLPAALGIAAVLVAAVVIWLITIISGLPDVSALKRYRPAVASEVLDKDGGILTLYYEKKFRIWAPVAGLPDPLIQAVVTAEDDTFFEHKGVNYKAAWNAFLHDVKKRRFARGGSTITQQMVKNVMLSRKKTIGRKIREYFLARKAEEMLTKRQILEIYMNEVEWGDNIYGVEAASRFYFDKHAYEVNLAEAALLAGMLPNPRYFNPLKRPDKARERQERVLANMLQARLITEAEREAAVEYTLAFRPDASSRFDFSILSDADHRQCYKKILERIFLKEYGEHALYRQGLSIKTSIDKELQNRLDSLEGEKQETGTPDRIFAVKEGGKVRAIACSTDENKIRDRLESLSTGLIAYDVISVSPDSLGREDVTLPVPGSP